MTKWLLIAWSLFISGIAIAAIGSRDSNYNIAISGGGSSFVGIGDLVTVLAFGSCARAYKSTYAATLGNGCDLVRNDAATCTTVFANSGFIDLTVQTPCGGSTVTAWMSGHTAVVAKVYDQVGTLTSGWTATGANRPTFTLSALGGLPCMTFNGSQAMTSSTSWATAGASTVPYSTSLVGERTGNTGSFQAALEDGTTTGFIGWDNSGNLDATYDGVQVVIGSATDNAFHAIQGLYTGNAAATTSIIYTDGTSSNNGSIPGNLAAWTGTPAIGGAVRPMTGLVCEVAFENGDQSGQFSNINSNQHGATNGYNF